MRPMIAGCLVCLLTIGCNSTPDAQHLTGVRQNEPLVIQTPEIVRILEQEPIDSIMTTHSQTIHISLKNGLRYRGTYVPAEAGKYSDDPHLADILNLVIHIKEHRPAEHTRGWSIACE